MLKFSCRAIRLVLVSVFFFSVSCGVLKDKTAIASGDDGQIEVVFLQMNDVYEISPGADNRGGLARVAAIRKELLAKNPNTFTVLAGDFISPSITGSLKYENKRIRGRHMVETLNSLGLDMVVFGNHEFDYDQQDLQDRMNESAFEWLGGNLRMKPQTAVQGGAEVLKPFYQQKPDGSVSECKDTRVLHFTDADGTTLDLGVFGVVINTGKKPWVSYTDWESKARESYSALQPATDAVIAITHLNIADDKKLAGFLPQIPLVMGGHDHNNMIFRIGHTTVAKADANAKTVYIHTLHFDKQKKAITVKSELRQIDAALPDEPGTAAVVSKWEKIREEALSAAGIDSKRIIADLKEPLDCRESVIRHQQVPVGQLITGAMISASRNKPDAAFLNSGSIRIDDALSGKLSELDVARMMPYGGAILEVEMRGSLLKKTLDAGHANKGNGGYLQLREISRSAEGKWSVAGKELDENKLYRIALPEFLLSGNESNMAFLKASTDADGKSNNPDIPVIIKPDTKDKSDIRNDIRLALIRFLSEK
ncbi:MAG: bifunctional metallophosphatase/5'-nucleotidase [Bacteroidota bacterium]